MAYKSKRIAQFAIALCAFSFLFMQYNPMEKKNLEVIGWREWVDLPQLHIKDIKAKVDTGARTSSLHAYDLEFFYKGKTEYVRFKVHPVQRNTKKTVRCEAEVLEYRKIRSSNGQVEKRPVILTPIKLMGQTWDIELTLTNRDEMGFRMLLGRESFKKRFLIDVGGSYFGLKKKKLKQRKSK
jgi:hypothetical protein